MKILLALDCLCENPARRTGLSTLYPRFVEAACKLHPEVNWLVFAESRETWPELGEQVRFITDYPANGKPLRRLFADHFSVAARARREGAAALVTTGFVPLRTAGLPIVMQLFSLHHNRGRGLREQYRSWASRRGLENARLVIVNSQDLASKLPLRPQRLLVSHEGLETERFVPTGERGWAALAPGYLLWSSNFYSYKRAELALAAYAALSPELQEKHPFVLVGGDWAGGLQRARAEAVRLGIQHKVHFLGWVPDAALPALYRGASALVLSTAEESFGRSVIESLACGTPVLLQDLPVLREVAGEAGVYVDFADTKPAAAAMTRLLTDENWRSEKQRLGLLQTARYSFERLAAERMEAILASLASGGI